MTSFTLKIIAAVSMLIDHVGKCLFPTNLYMVLLGRLAFPIFAYQTVYAYINTKNVKGHLLKLSIFAIISQYPYTKLMYIVANEFGLNVLFTFILAIISLIIYDKANNKIIGITLVTIISIISKLLKCDYGGFGIILTFIFYYFTNISKNKNSKLWLVITAFLLCNVKFIPNILEHEEFINYYFLLGIFTSLSLIPISMHNKKEGYKLKYFFYIFYPVHMLMIYIIYLNHMT